MQLNRLAKKKEMAKPYFICVLLLSILNKLLHDSLAVLVWMEIKPAAEKTKKRNIHESVAPGPGLCQLINF